MNWHNAANPPNLGIPMVVAKQKRPTFDGQADFRLPNRGMLQLPLSACATSLFVGLCGQSGYEGKQ